jgi:ADP-ribose pyrophosphatase YjhB (NUDIX family)
MKKSAGLLIINDNKILLCHPTRGPWDRSYSIPKGNIEKGESILDAAIRETKEEVGLSINKDFVDEDKMEVIEYKNKKGKNYKLVYYFPIYVNISLENIPKEKLQLDEVDWAGFLNKEEAKNKIFWRFDPMLNYIY